jgi:predicted transcriptional regulator
VQKTAAAADLIFGWRSSTTTRWCQVETERIHPERLAQDNAAFIHLLELSGKVRVGLGVAHAVDDELMQSSGRTSSNSIRSSHGGLSPLAGRMLVTPMVGTVAQNCQTVKTSSTGSNTARGLFPRRQRRIAARRAELVRRLAPSPHKGGPDLRATGGCHTLYDMKSSVLTIRLDPALVRQLARAARRSGRSRSELVRDALRRQLALTQLDDLRRRIMPLAEARGCLTDEDVFRDVS